MSFRLNEKENSMVMKLAQSVSNSLRNQMEKTPSWNSAIVILIYITSGPANLAFVTQESRRSSFKNWQGVSIEVQDFVESGFFLVEEQSDHVKCFFCDLGLKQWELNENPYEVHVKHSPLCYYMKNAMGLHFIQETLTKTGINVNIPQNFRRDHGGFLDVVLRLLDTDVVHTTRALGFSETEILLQICRRFIRDKKFIYSSSKILVDDLHLQWDAQYWNIRNTTLKLKEGPSSTKIEFTTLDIDLGSIVSGYSKWVKLQKPERSASERESNLTSRKQKSKKDTRLTKSDPTVTILGSKKCHHCEIRDHNIVALPCGHLCLCRECSLVLKKCPYKGCRKVIEKTVVAFLS